MVLVTPELVAPISKEQPLPDLEYPRKFLTGPGVATSAPRTPGKDQTGPSPATPKRNEISIQEMEKLQRDEQAQAQNNAAGAYDSGAANATSAMTLPNSITSSPVTQPQGPTQ